MPNMLDQLLDAGETIRVHENGFLYVNLRHGVDGRLHIWGETTPWDEWDDLPFIPCQRVRTPIHDHVFDMSSFVLGGAVKDMRYELGSPQSLVGAPMWECEALGGGLRVRHMLGLRRVVKAYGEWKRAGMYYHVPPRSLHETIASAPAVTLMMRTRTPGETHFRSGPRVMLPNNGSQPDNDFDRNSFDQNKLRELARYLFNEAMFEAPPL